MPCMTMPSSKENSTGDRVARFAIGFFAGALSGFLGLSIYGGSFAEAVFSALVIGLIIATLAAAFGPRFFEFLMHLLS